jgi:hypothetical protein
MISDYLESLAGALRFDRSLSRRLRQEVEDHLEEAVAADPAGGRHAAERRAVANFGDPHVIAAQFVMVSLVRRTTRVSVAVILAIAIVFVAMRARVALYVAIHWTSSADMNVVKVVAQIDRYAFWLSVIVGIIGWAYVSSRSIFTAFRKDQREQIRRCYFACTVATGVLIVAVISDAVLTAIWLLGTELSVNYLVPIFSMAIEIACVGVLVLSLRGIARQSITRVFLGT